MPAHNCSRMRLMGEKPIESPNPSRSRAGLPADQPQAPAALRPALERPLPGRMGPQGHLPTPGEVQ